MNLLKFYTILFLAGLLFPLMSFAQVPDGYLPLEAKYLSANLMELTTNESKKAGLHFKDEDDIKLAERNDTWIDDAWLNKDSTVYYYGDNGFLTEELKKTLDSTSAWVDAAQTTYTNDANGDATLESIQIWNGRSWINERQIVREYDVNGNETLFLLQNWDGSTWISASQSLVEYDMNNNLIKATNQRWGDGSWVNTFLISTDYDANNLLIGILQQTWGGDNWLDFNRFTITNDTNGYRIMDIIELWDGSNWVNKGRTDNTHDANGETILSLAQEWKDSTWVNSRKSITDRKPNGDATSYYTQTWVNDAWQDSYYEALEYDAYNNRTEYITQTWDDTALVNSRRNTAYYQIVPMTSIAQLELAHPVEIFINQANKQLTINFGKNEQLTGPINIYNMPGQLLHSQRLQGNQQTLVELSSFSAGTYYVQIIDKQRQTTQTFIVGQ